jgi:riboflavin synthase
VNAAEQQEFEVNLVPHTLAVTTLAGLAVGERVNLEVDVIARYTERLLAAG